VLEAAGVPLPDHLEGRPLGDGPREYVLTEDDFDVMVRIPLRTITTRRYKLTRYLDADGMGELYDLVDDPGELVNRWDDPAYAGIRSDLVATLADEHRPLGRKLPKVGLVG
jgi:arylsulfatase A-like enzyme